MACHQSQRRGLDTRMRPGLNLRMRALAAILVVLAAATAWARPRVQVAPFVVRGEGALGYFGPEVSRAVAAALEGAGVETGAGAESTLSGQVEELSGERVRLSATLRGRTLVAEGPLEAVDAVATQLANKIAPLLLENDPAAQRAAEKRARDAERRAAAVPPSRPAARATSARTLARLGETKPQPAQPDTPAEGRGGSNESSEARPGTTGDSPRADAPTAGAPTAGARPESKTGNEPKPESRSAEPPMTEAKPEAKTEAKLEGKPEAKTEAKLEVRTEAKSEPPRPDWSPPRVDVSPPRAEPPRPSELPPAAPQPSPYFGGFVRGRVVAHAVADPPSASPTAGAMATQALFSFLHRRMRLTVIPTGVGLTSVAIAADEGYRAGARAVVMARLEAVEYLAGPSARVRLEVVVVRDGRPVMRRAIESAPSDPNRRGPGTDPVYQAVTMALEALVPELVGALADVR